MRFFRNYLPALIVFGLVIGLAQAVLVRPIHSELFFTDSAANSFAVARSFTTGEIPLIGQPLGSSERQLGPIYYYALALSMWTSGGEDEATAIAFSLLLIAGALLSVLAAYYLCPPKVRGWAACASMVAIFAPPLLWGLGSPWVNHFLIAPAALFFVAFVGTLRRGWTGIFFFALAAGLTLQTQFGALPLVAACTALMLWHFARPAAAERQNSALRVSDLGAGLLAVLIWIPPLVYELRYGNNLRQLLAPHLAVSPHPIGPAAALKTVLDFFCRNLLGYKLQAVPELILISGSSAVLIGAYLIYRRGGPTARRFWAAMFLALVFYIPGLSRQEAAQVYYLNALLPLPIIAFGLLGGSGIAALTDGTERLLTRSLGALLIAALLVVGGVNLRRSTTIRPGTAAHPLQQLGNSSEIAEIIDYDREVESRIRVFVRGAKVGREDVIHYLLGAAFNPLIHEARAFRELPSFRQPVIKVPQPKLYWRKNETQPDPDVGLAWTYLLTCVEEGDVNLDRTLSKFSGRWLLDYEISLESCSSCDGCRLARLRKHDLEKQSSS